MKHCHLRHTRCQKLFLFPQAVAQQKKKAEAFLNCEIIMDTVDLFSICGNIDSHHFSTRLKRVLIMFGKCDFTQE